MGNAERRSEAAERWVKHVERQAASGLSIRAYAEREGVKPGTLSFWKWKLSREEKETPSVAPLKFVELTTRKAERPGSFEVVLRSGRAVRVPSGFEASELMRLVIVLEEAQS